MLTWKTDLGAKARVLQLSAGGNPREAGVKEKLRLIRNIS